MASAGDDKKISLWRKNGQSMGTIPIAGNDSGDNIEVSCLFNSVIPSFASFLFYLDIWSSRKTV